MDQVQIAEAGKLTLEQQRNRARGTMALFGDDQIGTVVGFRHPLLPLVHRRMVFFAIAVERDLLGHLLFKVIFVAVDEHHRVGVLLDRAGFAQVRKLRPLVVTILHLARKL